MGLRVSERAYDVTILELDTVVRLLYKRMALCLVDMHVFLAEAVFMLQSRAVT
jgi:hypothetical protein